VTGPEGNSGTTSFSFTVSLSTPAVTGASVRFRVVDGTATAADSDYTPLPDGDLIFEPGDQQKTVTVSVRGDNKFEPDETFEVQLYNPLGLTIADGTGAGTIQNDDPALPTITLEGAFSQLEGTRVEGGSFNTPFDLTVRLSSPAPSGGVRVDFETIDETATFGSQDYNHRDSSLTIPAGELERQITINVRADDQFEPDETFFLRLSNPRGGNFTNGAATTGARITILNDDPPPPTITLEGAFSQLEGTRVEGGSFNTPFDLTVRLSSPAPSGGVRVDFETIDETATFGSQDYNHRDSSLTIPAGELERKITINIRADDQFEPDETFFLRLSNPRGGTFPNGAATEGARITILNDDPPPPTISINDVSGPEGNSGNTAYTFTVSLSAPAPSAGVRVGYRTADDSARVGESDYNLRQGTLTFAQGESQKAVTVFVRGDSAFEPDEVFFVNLTNPVGATIEDGQGMGTIVNDDTQPISISINDVSKNEGDSCDGGTTPFIFTVSLSSRAPASGVTVNFTVAGGTAASLIDYILVAPPLPLPRPLGPGGPGQVSFSFGQQQKQIEFSVICDTVAEPDETFFVNLSNASRGVIIADAQGKATILNDDVASVPPPVISINDVSLREGNAGNRAFDFIVTLSRPAPALGVTVDFATADRGATSPADYVARSGRLRFLPGERQKQLTVQVIGDRDAEVNETFEVRLSSPVGGVLGPDNVATGTIENDDTPAVSISDVSQSEMGCAQPPPSLPGLPPPPPVCAPGIPSVFNFNVQLSGPASVDGLSVAFSTANGSARAGTDFVGQSGRVTFNRGERQKQVSITVNDDSLAEPNETFFVNLSSPAGLTVGDATATGTILDEDRTLSINDVSRTEGNSGITLFIFSVSLSAPAETAVGVDVNTRASGGTADARDFFAGIASSRLTFAAGERSQQVRVQVRGDTTIEPDETFFVELTNPTSNARIADARGQGTIVNDD
jgi:hypothetical protein